MCVCMQTTQAWQSSRRGLRPVVSTIRNEAEMMVVYAKELGKEYVGRASDLVKRLRQAGLQDTYIGINYQGREMPTLGKLFDQK